MNNRVVKLLGICFFIGGCCTFSPTSKKCTCEEIYQEVKYHLNENVDTTKLDGKRYIKNNKPYEYNEIIYKIRFWFGDNRGCWIGQKKQLIVDLLGNPYSYKTEKHGTFAKSLSYNFVVEMQSALPINTNRFISQYINVYYQKKLDEKIEKVSGIGTSIIIK